MSTRGPVAEYFYKCANCDAGLEEGQEHPVRTTREYLIGTFDYVQLCT